MPNVLDQVAHSVVVLKVGVENFFKNPYSRISLERGELETSTTEGVDRPLNRNLAFLIRLWINSSRVWMSVDSPISGPLSDCVSIEVFWRAVILAWS